MGFTCRVSLDLHPFTRETPEFSLPQIFELETLDDIMAKNLDICGPGN